MKARAIALLKERKNAIINAAVTKGVTPGVPMKPSGIDWLGDIPAYWEVKKLKYLSKTISKGTTPSTEGRGMADSGVRFIKAENIAKKNNKEKIVVISGIGVREYYRKLGYRKQGPYMVKKYGTS